MRKTTVEIDDELVARASAALGTRGIKATVEAALREVVNRERRLELFERLRNMDGLELDDEQVMADAWR